MMRPRTQSHPGMMMTLPDHGLSGSNGADEQLGKVTQWTNEKVCADSGSSCACYAHFQVFSGEKTSLSDDFTEYEKEVDVRRIGIERCVHSTDFLVRC